MGKRPKYYPLFLNIQGRSVLVVGGGRVAERKLKVLLDCGAKIRIISPEITTGLKKLVSQKRLVWRPRRFRLNDLRGAFLVYAATDDPQVNQLILTHAKRCRIPINVANLPGRSDFFVPAMVRRGDLLIAISTSGHSPALAKRIRRELDRTFGREFARFVRLLGRVRKILARRVSNETQRRRILNRIVQSEVLDLLRSGRTDLAKKRTEKIIGLKGISL